MVHQIFAFSSPCQLPSSSFKPRPLMQSTSFVLLKMVFKVRALCISSMSGPMVGCPKCVSIIYWLFWIKFTKEMANTRGTLRFSFLFLWRQEISLSCERCAPCIWRQKDPLITRDRVWDEKSFINKTCYFCKLLPQDQILFRFFTEYPKSTLLHPVNTSLIVSSSKIYRSYLFLSLLRSHFYENFIHMN